MIIDAEGEVFYEPFKKMIKNIFKTEFELGKGEEVCVEKDFEPGNVIEKELRSKKYDLGKLKEAKMDGGEEVKESKEAENCK
jgi:hypothetical protein